MRKLVATIAAAVGLVILTPPMPASAVAESARPKYAVRQTVSCEGIPRYIRGQVRLANKGSRTVHIRLRAEHDHKWGPVFWQTIKPGKIWSYPFLYSDPQGYYAVLHWSVKEKPSIKGNPVLTCPRLRR